MHQKTKILDKGEILKDLKKLSAGSIGTFFDASGIGIPEAEKPKGALMCHSERSEESNNFNKL
ncbi:MAG: hypothetical protein ACE5K2_03865, partial [Candidatus Zixiibacteriota bacterium]